MSSRDENEYDNEYDEDAPRPRRRKRFEEPENYDEAASASAEPQPKRRRAPRLSDEEAQPEPKPVPRKRAPRLSDEDERNAPVEKKPRRKAAQPPAEPAKRAKSTKAKQEKPKQPPVDRGKWRDATLHERILRIRWIMGLLYRYAPAWLIVFILIALFGPNLVRSMRNGLMPPLIAPFYTPSVQYWAPKLSQWATEYDVNPNLIATLMQIESCGYPGATSTVGAQGLFQVMPMNFAEGTENMTDPETNAKAGITVIRDCLRYADGDVGLAMACYNGGPSLISRSPETWPEESLRYYTWGTGIYNDAVRGLDKSETLDNWLQSGGQYLCAKASQTLGIATAQFTQAAPTNPPPPTVSLSTGGATSGARSTPLTAIPTINIQVPAAVSPTPSVKLFLTPTQ